MSDDHLTGTDRLLVDRVWREPSMHDLFRKGTGISLAQHGTEEYQRLFRIWAKGLLDGGEKVAVERVRKALP